MNDVVPAVAWDPNSGAALPAYLADAMGGLGTNIPDRQTVPSLSYEGKNWTIVKDGNKTKLQAKNSEGDMVPVPVMRMVILDFNADRGRAYYTGTYNPAASTAPVCWSADGKTPDASVKDKQCATCAACPQSVKGSKVQEGREMVACSSHRMIAILPAYDLNFEPLRLKIAVTSDYDKETVEHGWFAFRQYSDFLKSRGITHTALVVTKVKFDTNVAYPKLLFSLDRILTPDEIQVAVAATKDPRVQELLNEKWTAAGVDGTQKDESDLAPHGLEAAYADGWVAHPDSAGFSYKGQDVLANDVLAARYPAPAPMPAPAPTPTPPAIPAAEQVIDNPPQVPKAAAPAHDPIAAATADGWAVHPDNAAYYFKGSEVVAVDEVKAKYPAPADAAPAAPPAAPPAPPAAPPAPSAAPPAAAFDPIAAAKADGWVQHPDSTPHGYKGSDVLTWEEIAGRYSGNGSTPAGSTASADTGGSGTTGQDATTAASPSSEAVPADVKDLLDKWTGS